MSDLPDPRRIAGLTCSAIRCILPEVLSIQINLLTVPAYANSPSLGEILNFTIEIAKKDLVNAGPWGFPDLLRQYLRDINDELVTQNITNPEVLWDCEEEIIAKGRAPQ